jgi:MFS family permease
MTEEKPSRIFLFISLSALYFFSIVPRVGIAVVAESMIHEFSADATIIGLMSSAYFFPYAIAQIPVGVMLDRVGVKKTIGTLGIIASVGNALFALSPSLLLVTAGRALVGFGVGGFYISCLKALALWFQQDRFATLLGLLTAFGNFGAFFASSPLALISVSIGWRGAYFAIFVLMSIFIFLSWMALPHERHLEATAEKHTVKDLKEIFHYKWFLVIMMIPFLAYGTYISFQGLWSGPFLANIYGMDDATVGFFLTFISIGFIISSPLGGHLSDKVFHGRKPVLLVGILLSLFVWVTFGVAGASLTPMELILTLFVLGFATGFIYVFMAMSRELFPERMSGTAMASFNQFNFIGGGFFQYFMGFMIDFSFAGVMSFPAFQMIFIISAVACVISAILTIASKETFGHQPGNESSSYENENPRTATYQ